MGLGASKGRGDSDRTREPAAALWQRSYQDDIFVTGNTDEELQRNVERMLTFLQEMKMTMNPSKLQWYDGPEGIAILGVQCKDGKLSIPEGKQKVISATLDALLHKGAATKREIFKLIGKLNFFRHLSLDCAIRLWPIYEWVKTFPSWDACRLLTEELQTSLKSTVSNLATWMTAATLDRVLTIRVDSSGKGAGAVVVNEDGAVLHHWSHQWVDPTSDSTLLELCGLRSFLEKNQSFLSGNLVAAWVIESDSANLVTYLTGNKDSDCKLKSPVIRRIEQLFRDYDWEISFRHLAGEKNVEADALSRGLPLAPPAA